MQPPALADECGPDLSRVPANSVREDDGVREPQGYADYCGLAGPDELVRGDGAQRP